MRTRKDIERRAESLGLEVKTYSPGDGITRYRFFPNGSGQDYFEGSVSNTALGVKEADVWLDGFMHGRAFEEAIRR